MRKKVNWQSEIVKDAVLKINKIEHTLKSDKGKTVSHPDFNPNTTHPGLPQ